MSSTPAKATVKVAVINNAAKDDVFQDLDWLKEDQSLCGSLNVLANDPGSAHLIGVSQSLPTSPADLTRCDTSFVPAGFTGAISVSIDPATGQLLIDAQGLNDDLQSLGDGQSTSITFYYTAQMANGAYSTAMVTIDIQGTNDDPVFSASSQFAGTVTDTAGPDDLQPIHGTVSATDVDSNDAGQLTYGFAPGHDGASDYGTFAIDATGHWTFTPDDGAVEGLKDTKELTFDIQVSDGHGGSATETVTITLDGVNDTAEFSGVASGEVTEDDTTPAGGTLSVTDRDVDDHGFQTATEQSGDYGTFGFDASTGQWTYALNNDADNVQKLGDGDTVYDTLTVHSADGTPETITVTIHGANDDPEFAVSSDLTGTVTDTSAFDNLQPINGAVSATDVDTNDAGQLTYGYAAGEDGSSAYGAFEIDTAGNWTFTPDDAAVEGLKISTNIDFHIEVSDGHGGSAAETVTITLAGADDTAVISGNNAGEVTEDGATTTGDTLSVSDRDANESTFQAADPDGLAGQYGTFGFNASTGQWTYTLNNSSDEVQALNASDTLYDQLTVRSADGNTWETITVTIHGANDAPSFVYTPPVPYTGTGDPNDFDNLGNSAGQNLSSSATTGPDTIYGGAGNDTINGGNGADTLYGGSGADGLGGGNQGDTLYGGSGIDTIGGGNDDDTIMGGYGADILSGSGGNDSFVYLSALDTGDTISDFTAGDTINLHALGVTGFAGALSGAGEVGNHQVGYMTSAGVTTLYVDVDGIFGADLEIHLSNGHTAVAGDFVL